MRNLLAGLLAAGLIVTTAMDVFAFHPTSPPGGYLIVSSDRTVSPDDDGFFRIPLGPTLWGVGFDLDVCCHCCSNPELKTYIAYEYSVSVVAAGVTHNYQDSGSCCETCPPSPACCEDTWYEQLQGQPTSCTITSCTIRCGCCDEEGNVVGLTTSHSVYDCPIDLDLVL